MSRVLGVVRRVTVPLVLSLGVSLGLPVVAAAGAAPIVTAAAVTTVAAPTILAVVPGWDGLTVGARAAPGTTSITAQAVLAGVPVGSAVTATPGPAGDTFVTVSGLAAGKAYSVTVTGTAPGGVTGAATAGPTLVGGGPGEGEFVPVGPQRSFDFREPQAGGPLRPGETRKIAVSGVAGVPSSGVAAVAVAISVVAPTAAGYVTAWPSGSARPTTTAVNFVAGQTKTGLVKLPVDATGTLSIYNFTGSTGLTVDVVGFYLDGSSQFSHAMGYASVRPVRALDTRPGTGAAGGGGVIPGGGTVRAAVAGAATGVPVTAAAVELQVEAIDPAADGYLTVWAAGAPSRPVVSNVLYSARRTIVTSVIAPVGADGAISVFSNVPTHVAVDVTGYYDAAAGGRFRAIVPARLYDSRSGSPWLPQGVEQGFMIAGQRPWGAGLDAPAPIPREASGVVFSATAVGNVAATYATFWPGGLARPLAAMLLPNAPAPGVFQQLTDNLVTIGLGDGAMSAYNHVGSLTLVIDVYGYYVTDPRGAVGPIGAADWSRTDYYGGNWATPDDRCLYRDPSGDLGIIAHDRTTQTVTFERRHRTTYALVGARTTVSQDDWPLWGGCYAAPDGSLYLLLGRANPTENDSAQVLALRRYSVSGSLTGTAYLTGGVSHGIKGIYEPFMGAAAHMVAVGSRLVIHMARLMYAIDGVHHQGNLTFEVDLTTMTAKAFSELGGYVYSSHAFQTLVTMRGTDLITVDHGDAYPRAVQLGVMSGYPAQRVARTYRLMDFNGTIGDNFTGATVTGLEGGPSGVLVVGNSITHPNAPSGPLGNGAEARNSYLIWADPATGTHTVTWLTSFPASGSQTAEQSRLVAIGNDRFALVFSVRDGATVRTEYRLLNSAGTVLASKTFGQLSFPSAVQPTLVGTRLVWTANAPEAVNWWSPTPHTTFLFGFDVSDPLNPALLS